MLASWPADELSATAGRRRADRRRVRAARDEGRAALMPYLMGGFPTCETSLAIGEAYADAGADLIELGVPFSDPLADGPVDPRRRRPRRWRPARRSHGVLEVCAARSPSGVPVVLMVYANMVLARGAERVRAARSRPRAPPARSCPTCRSRRPSEVRAALRRRRAGARAAGRADHARRAPARGSAPRARGLRLRRLHRRHHRRARRAAAGARRAGRARPRRDAEVPGRGRLRHRHARAGAPRSATVADGVIVGSRLVRAAGEARLAGGGRRAPSPPSCARRATPSPGRIARRMGMVVTPLPGARRDDRSPTPSARAARVAGLVFFDGAADRRRDPGRPAEVLDRRPRSGARRDHLQVLGLEHERAVAGGVRRFQERAQVVARAPLRPRGRPARRPS